MIARWFVFPFGYAVHLASKFTEKMHRLIFRSSNNLDDRHAHERTNLINLHNSLHCTSIARNKYNALAAFPVQPKKKQARPQQGRQRVPKPRPPEDKPESGNEAHTLTQYGYPLFPIPRRRHGKWAKSKSQEMKNKKMRAG